LREIIELRLHEDEASIYLKPDEGVRLNDTVRKLVLVPGEPRFEEIRRIELLRKQRNEAFVFGWRIRRRYSRGELAEAKLFQLQIVPVFEPTGEECGTEYDDSRACDRCGAGRIQRSPLRLRLDKIPRGRHLAQTIGGETLIRTELAHALTKEGLTGFDTRDVYDSSFPKTVSDEYKQLLFESKPVIVSESTKCGINPLDLDEAGEFVCPEGHVIGLNLVSELYVSRKSWDGSDVCRTRQHIGSRQGLLVPEPVIVVSPRCFEVLQRRRIKGALFERAHME
jgi:hypothetical protein